MNIVTIGDSNYFHCFQCLSKNVKKFYKKSLIVYDIGLKRKEKKLIDAQIIPIKIKPEVDFSSFYKVDGYNSYISKSTHRPFCVRHYFNNFSEPMILIDVDCLFRERVEKSGFDIGITVRQFKKTWMGGLNTGVLFFNRKVELLIREWIEDFKMKNIGDQQALFNILAKRIDFDDCDYNKIYNWKKIRIKIFRAEEYNDKTLKQGKIIHFAGIRHSKEIYEKLIYAIENNIDINKIVKQFCPHMNI